MAETYDVYPAPHWKLEPEDLPLTPAQFLNIPRFYNIRKSPKDSSLQAKLRRCHGALVLRRYRQDAVICRQGAAGASAFFILSSADLYGIRASIERQTGNAEKVSETVTRELQNPALRDDEVSARRRKLEKVAKFIKTSKEFLSKLPVPRNDDEKTALVAAHEADMTLAKQTKEAEAQGDVVRAARLHRLSIAAAVEKVAEAAKSQQSEPELAQVLTEASRTQSDDPIAVAFKEPAEKHAARPVAAASGRVRQAKMYERELFGEMACKNRRPRSASVRAERDCFIIEMLGNVLEILEEDALIKAEMEETYRRRILELHLRETSLFRHLPDAELDRLCTQTRSSLEIVSYASGDVICKQGDPSDCVYLIRRGWVQIRVNVELDPNRVLTYRAPGDFIGEMGLIHADWSEAELQAFQAGNFEVFSAMPRPAPRSATCIAVAHPDLPKVTEKGDVELIKISYEELWNWLKAFPGIRTELWNKARERRQETQRWLASPIRRVKAGELFSEALQPLGLYLGQRLMLIDLDRCTRCDECVQACVKTHRDGRSRLFLDGPRADLRGQPYLVPATCRSCLDPICMIGCPTRAIQRGAKDEMVINADWCIGCAGCANKCPYGAIHMHDLGIIPARAQDWYYRLAADLSSAEAETWFQLPARTKGWVQGASPFQFTRDFRESLLAPARPGARAAAVAPTDAICFLHPFKLTEDQVSPNGQYLLELVTAPKKVSCWVDGKQVEAKEKSRTYEFGLADRAQGGTKQHLLALLVEPNCASGAKFLEVRLDRLRVPQGPYDIFEEFTEKALQPRLAVVCDLCSDLPAGPACVRACPHEAAFRIDAPSGLSGQLPGFPP